MADTHQTPPSTPHTAQPKTATDARTAMISNVLGIVGIVILIVIAIWGLLHLATLSGGWFTSKKSDTIIVSAPKDVYSGETFLVSWKYTPAVKGTYAIMYQCSDKLRFAAPTTDKNFIPLPCGAAFTVGNATNTIAVMPLLAGSSTIAESITVLYIPSATSTTAKSVQGAVTVNVHPSALQQVATTTKPAETKPSKPSTTTTQPTATGPADLRITLITLSVDQYGNGVASFDIANVGGGSSGTYYFEAQLPTAQPYTYYSPAQASLSPGSHIVNTLNFSQASPGFFSASVDPQNLIRESNESNNTIGQYLATPYPIY